MSQKLDNFEVYFLNSRGDIKERSIHHWHLADDFWASGVFIYGGFDTIKIDGPTTSGYVLTTDADGYGTWQPGAATSFLGLTDTPASYLGFEASGVRVNVTGTGLEFYPTSGGGGGGPGTSGYSGFSGYSGTSGYSGYSGKSGYSGFSGYSGYSGFGISGYSGSSGYSGASASGAIALDDLTDVSTSGEVKNQVLKFNGTSWVPAAYDYSFTFSINTFTDDQTDTQLIGNGVWRTTGNINFTASYLNGPPVTAYIVLSSDGGVTWGSDLTLLTPFTSASSAENTNYPSSKDKYVNFTLHAAAGESSTSTQTVTFRNNVKYGPSVNTSWTSADINALSGTLLSNIYTGSFTPITSGVGDYVIFAHPSTYTSIHSNGFIYNSVTCPFESAATVSVTNGSGYTENYKVYRSTNSNLGNSTLVTSTASSLIDNVYWGVSTVTGSYTESDVEGLGSSVASNTKGRTFTVIPAASYYIIYALPVRLGTVTFWVGGFEGGFLSPETVSVTNVNGYTESYYVYRSTNSGLGSTTVQVI